MQRPNRAGFAWLELVLAVAFIALVMQVFPTLATTLLSALDFRTWSRSTWFALNLLVLLGLFGIRFGPELYGEWQARRCRLRGGAACAAAGTRSLIQANRTRIQITKPVCGATPTGASGRGKGCHGIERSC